MACNHGRFSTLAPPCRERLPASSTTARAGRGGPAAQRAVRGGRVHSPVAPGRALPDLGQPLAPPAPARHPDPFRGHRRQRLLALPRAAAGPDAGPNQPSSAAGGRHRTAALDPRGAVAAHRRHARCWPNARSGRCATRTDSCCWTWTGPCGRYRRSPSRPTLTAVSTCVCRSTSTSRASVITSTGHRDGRRRAAGGHLGRPADAAGARRLSQGRGPDQRRHRRVRPSGQSRLYPACWRVDAAYGINPAPTIAGPIELEAGAALHGCATA